MQDTTEERWINLNEQAMHLSSRNRVDPNCQARTSVGSGP